MLLSIIAKHCPLKQGLRQSAFPNSAVSDSSIAKHCPLKQGLRLLLFLIFKGFYFIAKHCPLKQGLRHEYNYKPF